MSYKLKLDVFEGPLDLLLYLIKKNDVDIYDIPIAAVTDQYMEYIEMMKMLDLEVIGEFLVLAATLMQIKSRMLLPPDPSEVAAEEDPRDELVRRLQEYQMFKEVAEQLKEHEAARQNFFARNIDEEQRKELQDDAKEVYFEASLFDLISAFTAAIRKVKVHDAHVVTKEEFTVDQKIHELLHLLLEAPQIVLSELFGKARDKMEIIVLFMAMLELIRLREVMVMQKRAFDEIFIVRNKANIIPNEPANSEEPAASSETPAGEGPSNETTAA